MRPVASLQPPGAIAFLDGKAELPKSLAHPAGILGLQASAKHTAPRSQGGEEQGSVGDGLGARDPNWTKSPTRSQMIVFRK
jgi:hypothetical protein